MRDYKQVKRMSEARELREDKGVWWRQASCLPSQNPAGLRLHATRPCGIISKNDGTGSAIDAAEPSFFVSETRGLYQINLIKSFLIKSSIARRTQRPRATNPVNWGL